jgi:hypothetical protein
MAACIPQVKKVDDSVGPAVEEAVKGLSNGEVIASAPHVQVSMTYVQAGALSGTHVRLHVVSDMNLNLLSF